MKKKRIFSAVLTVVLCLGIILGAVGIAGAENGKKETKTQLKIAVMSDTHYLSPDLIKGTEDYTTDLNSDRKSYTEGDAVISAMLDAVREDKPDVLLISGDLTKDGERECHEAMAKKLKALKADLPNLKVYVAPGNHDVRNENGKNFNTADGKAVPATRTEPSDFKEIYADVSYNDETVIATYTPPAGTEAGGLSYVARPADGYTVIVMDTGRYSKDNTSNGKNEHETSGQISKAFEAWVVEQITAAKDRGDTVIGLEHHGLVPHFTMEPDILSMYLVNDYERIATEYADAGMSYVFTGHMHANDVAEMTTEAGNTLLDIETGSALTYPAPMRFVIITREIADGNVKETISGVSKTNIGPITFKDPATGEMRTIENFTEFTKAHGFTKDMLTTVVAVYLPDFLASPQLLSLLNSLIIDLCDTPVGPDKTLLDLVNYIYQSHLAGLDSGLHPDWVNSAIAKVESGEILRTLLSDVIVKNLAALPENVLTDVLSKIPVIGDMIGCPINLSLLTQFTNTAMNSGINLAIKMFPQLFNTLNNFLLGVIDSMGTDTNFPTDNTFSAVRTYQIYAANPDDKGDVNTGDNDKTEITDDTPLATAPGNGNSVNNGASGNASADKGANLNAENNASANEEIAYTGDTSSVCVTFVTGAAAAAVFAVTVSKKKEN